MLWRIALGLLCAAALIICVAWMWLRWPDWQTQKNPVLREIASQTRQWDMRVPLMPGLLKQGQSQQSVYEVLSRSGFRPAPNFKFYHSEDKVAPSEIVWSREHHSRVCNREYAVLMTFDDDMALQNASGVIGERGCL